MLTYMGIIKNNFESIGFSSHVVTYSATKPVYDKFNELKR